MILPRIKLGKFSRHLGLAVREDEVEAVARAFYDALDNARGWELEPEILKERLRRQARVAIAILAEHEAEKRLRLEPLIVRGPLQAARSYLMQAQEVGVVPGATMRAVLTGPDLAFDEANEDFSRLVGHRQVVNMPIRAAFPELAGQGYYELLEQVLATGEIFAGEALPMRLQVSPGGPLEEHYIDTAYRPIRNPDGRILGIFAEACDRTEWARAK